MISNSPTRRGLFAGAALVTILASPFAAMAAEPASQIPRLEQEREKLRAYVNDPARSFEDDEVQALMEQLHDIEDQIADAPCLTKADAIAKLGLIAQIEMDCTQGWEADLAREVAEFIART